MLLTWMQFFLFQVVQFQHHYCRTIDCMVIKVNQSNLRLWVVHSLRRRIAAADIKSEQPLTFRWCEISRCNMEGSGRMFSVFFTTKKCCSSGWLHVFDVAITPGILFYCALAADTIKSGKKEGKKREKGKIEERKKWGKKEKKERKNSSPSTHSFMSWGGVQKAKRIASAPSLLY